MNDFNKVIKEMTDDEVREAIFEMLEDEKRNDGVITSKWVRKIAQKYSELAGNNPIFLTTAQINLYKEGCIRFVKKPSLVQQRALYEELKKKFGWHFTQAMANQETPTSIWKNLGEYTQTQITQTNGAQNPIQSNEEKWQNGTRLENTVMEGIH